MQPEDPLYEFAKSERVSTPEKEDVSNGAALIGKLKCWWQRTHVWMFLEAIDSGKMARICRRCDRLEHWLEEDGHWARSRRKLKA